MSQVCIPEEEFARLKKKAAIADELVLQLDSSFKDLEAGRVKRVR
jgi:hypothetical protein